MTRTALSQRRRWCPLAETHQDENDTYCGALDCDRKPRIRRMLVCSECELGYFKREDFDDHECYAAY